MAKRRHADAVKAGENNESGMMRGTAISSSRRAGKTETGKSVAQLQAEVIAQKWFTDLMADAGLSGRSMRLELMNWIPADFRDQYMALTTRALRDTDGGMAARGESGRRTGDLGRAAAPSGWKAGGAGQKKYKTYWTIQDEAALELKSKIDRRLRSIAREIKFQLSDEGNGGNNEGNKGESKVGDNKVGASGQGNKMGSRCDKCKVITSPSWKYCCNCGSSLK